MAACGQNLVGRPYLFGPLSTPIYIEIHRAMVIIWPSDIYLWIVFGSLWPARKMIENPWPRTTDFNFFLESGTKCVSWLCHYLNISLDYKNNLNETNFILKLNLFTWRWCKHPQKILVVNYQKWRGLHAPFFFFFAFFALSWKCVNITDYLEKCQLLR